MEEPKIPGNLPGIFGSYFLPLAVLSAGWASIHTYARGTLDR